MDNSKDPLPHQPITQHINTRRRNRSAVSFSMDNSKGPLPHHFQQAASPTQKQQQQAPLEAVVESRPESRELAGRDSGTIAQSQQQKPWSPEGVEIPEAILEVR